MKIAFSTLGCPGWSWEEIISTAKDFGYDGIEIRGIGRELHIPNAKIFQPDNIDETKAKLLKLGLEISALSSAVRLNEQYKIDEHITAGKEYIELAEKLGVQYVRVLADSLPEPSNKINVPEIVKALKELALYAEDHGIVLLVETNGYFADSANMVALMEEVASPAVAVLWDVHHPYRYFNESIDLTYSRLKPYIKYIHLKDSLMTDDGKVEYQMMGYGDLPIIQAVNMLKADKFEGYLSMEWLKRWCHNLAEPGIVLPHYVNYIRKLLK
jgi:fatty-acyl-CoA synthase